MKKQALLITVLVVAVVSFVGLVPNAGRVHAQGPSSGCQALNDSSYDGVYYSETLSSGDFYKGEVIRVTVADLELDFQDEPVVAINGERMAYLEVDASVVDSTLIPGQMTYTFPADASGVSVEWYVNYEGLYDWTVECVSVLPGCDVVIDIPSDAVVGAFVSDALAYWAPDFSKATFPPIIIEQGKTAWVLELDEGGQFYKILWVCDILYVPVETMGPNYDDVWQGAPLPSSLFGPDQNIFKDIFGLRSFA